MKTPNGCCNVCVGTASEARALLLYAQVPNLKICLNLTWSSQPRSAHREAAPPERARVMPQTPPGEIVESDDEEWNVPNGQDAPMTPVE